VTKSCYVLELSVVPGSARRGEIFTYNRLAHIRRCLEQELSSPEPADRAYAASLAARGETMALWVVDGGKLVSGIDLRRHVRLRVDDDPPVPLTEAPARDEAWQDRLVDGTRVSFEIDWDAIASETPPLRGEPLRPGESLDLTAEEDVLAPFDSYLEIADELVYGHDDLEGGQPAAEGFVDPDPPK
jgi:hypothetical protein